jgi:HEPN domain-containing protein
MKEEANNWIKQAEADLRKAKILMDNHEFDGTTFYSQQTAEKALKAVIIKTQGKLVKIHDLVILGRMVGLPKSFLEKCEVLSKVYIESRYGFLDNEIPAEKFEEKDVLRFMNIAKEVLEWAKKI